MHLLAPLAFLKTEMTDFPTISCSSTSEIPTLSYTWSPKKKVPFRAEPARIGHYKDSSLSPRETELPVQSNSPHVWLILVCIFPQIEWICDTQYEILKPLYSFFVHVRAVWVKGWLTSMSQVTTRITFFSRRLFTSQPCNDSPASNFSSRKYSCLAFLFSAMVEPLLGFFFDMFLRYLVCAAFGRKRSQL